MDSCDSDALKVINRVQCRCTSCYCAHTALLCTVYDLTRRMSLRHLDSISGQCQTDNTKYTCFLADLLLHLQSVLVGVIAHLMPF